MNIPSAKGLGRRASEITLVDAVNGKPFPPAPPGSVLLSSAPLGWRGIVVEWHRLEPQELPEHSVVGHGLAVCTGTRSVPFGWRDGGRWREGELNPGEFHLLTHGEHNTPRWLRTFEEISLVLDRQFVAEVVADGLPSDRIEFVTRHSVSDAAVGRYAEAFRSELAAGSPNGLLYAETLAVALALHLLSTYSVARPKVPSLRGKLSSWQLRAVVDFIQSHLDEEVSLVVLSERAKVSPFHFARQFRATVGMAPHQFLLRQRVYRSIRLLEAGALPLAQIAVESGFHDQPHFTKAFRKLVGTTPGKYSGRR